MTTAKSSFSFTRVLPFYRNTLRRYRGSALFYGALGFLFLPLQYLLTILENTSYMMEPNWTGRYLIGPSGAYNGFAVGFFTALSLIVPLVMATNMYGYLQNRRSVDVYHSLPLKREELFFGTAAAGLTLIWVPMIVNFLLVAIMSLLVPGASTGMILLELLCWMATSLSIFAITAFVAVQVGTVFDTAMFSMAINASFAGVYLIIVALSDAFLYGYRVSSDMAFTAYKLSPVSLIIGRQAFNLRDAGATQYLLENHIAILIWLAVSVALLWSGAKLYSKRKSEQAESVGNLGPLQVFVRTVGTLVGGYCIGIIFCLMFNIQSKTTNLIAIGIGALLCYFIGDVILTRSVRSLPRALPVALATTLVVCLIVGAVIFGGLGFETRIPDPQKVVSVNIGRYNGRFDAEPLFERDSSDIILTDPAAIALVTDAHRAQVEAFKAQGSQEASGNDYRLTIQYQLASGRTMQRSYDPLYDSTIDKLLSLEGNKDFIQTAHPIFRAEAEDIQRLEVTNALGSKTAELKLTHAQKEQLLEAMRQDLLEQPESEWRTGVPAVASVIIELPERAATDEYSPAQAQKARPETGTYEKNTVLRSEILVTGSFTRTLKALGEFGASEVLSNNFDDVENAWVGVIAYGSLGSNPVLQANRVQLDNVGSEVFSSYSKFEGNEASAFVELTSQQLLDVKNDLTSLYSSGSGFASVIVAVQAKGVLPEGEEGVTGYYFLPIGSLPQSVRDEVLARGAQYYGTWSMVSFGYLTAEQAELINID